MRIISGKFKGRKIFLPENKKTRPLRDLVKESIFNLINHSSKFKCNIHDSNILDLFSGTGSFGIECLSRKAKKVTFIENYNEAIAILHKNILALQEKVNFEIIEENCFNFFISRKFFCEKFDLIFMDPPYKEKKINLIIEQIKKKKF